MVSVRFESKHVRKGGRFQPVEDEVCFSKPENGISYGDRWIPGALQGRLRKMRLAFKDALNFAGKGGCRWHV